MQVVVGVVPVIRREVQVLIKCLPQVVDPTQTAVQPELHVIAPVPSDGTAHYSPDNAATHSRRGDGLDEF